MHPYFFLGEPKWWSEPKLAFSPSLTAAAAGVIVLIEYLGRFIGLPAYATYAQPTYS